jgi:SAM-dependent methyltransferase
MVAEARRRCPELTFVEGDAQRLPFPDASFDVVTTNFGILHLSRPESALAEARRVLVPGGGIAFTAWVDEDNAVAEIVDGAISSHALPVELPEGPAFYRFGDPEECRRALSDAGFDADSIGVEILNVLWRVQDAELLFEAELHAGCRTAAVLAGQPPERLEAIRTAMADGIRRYAADAGFELPIAANVASARTPA